MAASFLPGALTAGTPEPTCQSRAFHRGSGGEKKPRWVRGCRSLACVEERLLVVIRCARCPVSCFYPGPGISWSVALARWLPKGAAAPLIPGYEQHPCQPARKLKRCDMLRCRGCTNVTRRTIRGHFSRSKSCLRHTASACHRRQNSQSVKILDAFRRACFSARRPGKLQVIEFN